MGLSVREGDLTDMALAVGGPNDVVLLTLHCGTLRVVGVD
jgi:hypothetical protein